MLKIEIQSTDIQEFTSKAGKPYYKQTGYAHLMDRNGKPDVYPSKITFMVPKDTFGQPQPYPPGDYSMKETSFRTDRFGSLEIGFLEFKPITTKPIK